MPIDPIQEIEKSIKDAHNTTSKYTKPVFRKYPLSFGFAITFSLAAIIKGFDLVAEKIQLFVDHPYLLIIIGSVILFLTGTLYKTLSKK